VLSLDAMLTNTTAFITQLHDLDYRDAGRKCDVHHILPAGFLLPGGMFYLKAWYTVYMSTSPTTLRNTTVSDKNLYKMDLGGGEILPAWTVPVPAQDEFYFDNVSMCEQHDNTCATPVYWTGIEGDSSIVLCSTHVLEDLVPVTAAEYAELVKAQQAGYDTETVVPAFPAVQDTLPF
jgi:hypothetical protein